MVRANVMLHSLASVTFSSEFGTDEVIMRSHFIRLNFCSLDYYVQKTESYDKTCPHTMDTAHAPCDLIHFFFHDDIFSTHLNLSYWNRARAHTQRAYWNRNPIGHRITHWTSKYSNNHSRWPDLVFVNMFQNIRSLDARQQFSCQIQNIVDISNFQTNFHGEPIHNYALI